MTEPGTQSLWWSSIFTLFYQIRFTFPPPFTQTGKEGVKEGNMLWKEYKALYQDAGSQATTVNLITTSQQRPLTSTHPCIHLLTKSSF